MDAHTQVEDLARVKADLEERLVKTGMERADLALHLRENEEEVAEVIEKYKTSGSPINQILHYKIC